MPDASDLLLRLKAETRGMCTRHVEENFQRLAAAVEAERFPEAAEAVALLEQALRYHHPVARELQERAPELASTAVTRVLDRHPDWAPAPTSRRRCEDDALYHLSYLADAVANGRDELFVQYVCWVAGFLERFRVPREHTPALLAELDRAIEANLSPESSVEPRRILTAAQAALGGAAP